MCFGSPTSGAVQYPSCLCPLMPVYSRAFNRALAEAKSPAPSGLPAHLKDGGDPLLPNPAWPFVHLTGPLPFRTTPKAETAERAQGGYNCLQPWSCPAPPHLRLDPKIKSLPKAGASPPCSRRALCRRSLSLSKTSIVLPATENTASGPVAPRPKLPQLTHSSQPHRWGA